MAEGGARAAEELQLSVCIGVDEDDELAADEAALRNCFPELPVSTGMPRPEQPQRQLLAPCLQPTATKQHA